MLIVPMDEPPSLEHVVGKNDARVDFRLDQESASQRILGHDAELLLYDEKQVALQSSFLLSNKDDDLLAHVQLPEAGAQSIARGEKLVSDYGCTACHRVNGVTPPESLAPDLSRIGSKPLFPVGFIRGMPETLPDHIARKSFGLHADGRSGVWIRFAGAGGECLEC
jgi:hypothetical protein